MVDDDDVSWVAILWPSGGGWFLALLGMAVIVVLVLVAVFNNDECAKKHCNAGNVPVLMHHDCLCVEKATP